MISNANKYISWAKVGCNDYTVTNLTDDPVLLKIEGETNDFKKDLTIEKGIQASFEIPSDGVYKVCANGKAPTSYTVLDESQNNTEKRAWSIFEIEASAFDFNKLIFDGQVVYDENVDGAASLANTTNFDDALDNNLPSGVIWEIVPPSFPSSLPNTGFLGGSAGASSNFRIIFSSTGTTTSPPKEANKLIISPSGVVCYLDPINYCQVEFVPSSASFQYINGLVIDGVNLLSYPTTPFQKQYDLQKNPSELSLFYNHISEWLVLQGATVIESAEPMVTWQRKACKDSCTFFDSITYANLESVEGCTISWCDYLYEFCALHKCITSKIKKIFCEKEETSISNSTSLNPCGQQARESMLELSTLFFYGLIPLVSKDRMEYLGDLVIDESRIKNVNKIKDIYQKILEYADRCNQCIEELDSNNDKNCPCGC